MNTLAQISAQYEASKVKERSNWCPRNGFYKIKSTYNGTCLNKPAVMAVTQWRATNQDIYSALTVEIQLESFMLNANLEQRNLLNSKQISGLEIEVIEASYFLDTKFFKLTWKIISVEHVLESLNNALKSGDFDLNTLINDQLDIVDDWDNDY